MSEHLPGTMGRIINELPDLRRHELRIQKLAGQPYRNDKWLTVIAICGSLLVTAVFTLPDFINTEPAWDRPEPLTWTPEEAAEKCRYDGGVNRIVDGGSTVWCNNGWSSTKLEGP